MSRSISYHFYISHIRINTYAIGVTSTILEQIRERISNSMKKPISDFQCLHLLYFKCYFSLILFVTVLFFSILQIRNTTIKIQKVDSLS